MGVHMESKMAKLLQCERCPVAVIRTNKRPDDALMFKEGARGCTIALLNAASKGRTVAFSDATVGCPGGKSGCGFRPFQTGFIEYFLSVGGKGPQEGEFYKESPELAKAFVEGLPSIHSEKYLVLKPFGELSEGEAFDAVVFLVNAEELSALVTLANYDQSTQDHVEIRFAAGCAQTFLYPLDNQDQQKETCTVGLTDPSARKCIEKDLLSFTIPQHRFWVMEEKAVGSFLTKETWKTLLQRK